MHTEQADHEGEWLSLQEASDKFGVAPSTLRRWGDAGRVPMKRTLGGHRRFPRAAIERLVGQSTPAAEITMVQAEAPHSWGVDGQEMARQEWHARLATAPAVDRMRGLGQRLLGLLIQYINRREDDRRFLTEARLVGSNYGREARAAKVSLHDTVQAFLFFRGGFAQLAMPLPGIAQPTDLVEAMALHKRIDHFMDAILLGVIIGYEAGETGKE